MGNGGDVRSTAYVGELAVVATDADGAGPGHLAEEVVITVANGVFTDVAVGATPPPGAVRLPGLTLPGFADAHSHAFHRALRGRTHADGGTFWSWRQRMYEVAGSLDPDGYHALARAVYAEMAATGFTSVGEFHYLHHRPDGGRYDDANAMGHALIAAARDAGIRITLLDACYLTGGIGEPLTGVQRRFDDGDAGRWAERVDELATAYRGDPDVVVGAAVHSVRAVPAEQIPEIVAWARGRTAPLHAHVSEQPAENEACLAAYGRTPVQVLTDAGFGGALSTAVHATHLTAEDIERLGATGTCVCFCPTTERDLGDGIGPADELVAAGALLTLGTDQHARIDAFEEARAVELNLRLAHRRRGCLEPGVLLAALTSNGQASLGFGGGRIAVGQPADLVAVSLTSPRTAGAEAASAIPTALFAASDADVTDVVVDGERVVTSGLHRDGDVGAALTSVIRDLGR